MHFCGTLDAVRSALGGGPAAWTKQQLTYWVAGSLPGVSSGTFESAAAQAFAAWAAVTPLTFRAAQRGEAPDIVVDAGKIDGPGSVLAYSELPDGSDRQLKQKYDTSEKFVVAARPPADSIDLLAVMTHEIGHALGLDHADKNAPDLMAPYYKPGLRTPQPGDVARMQALYGPPKAPPVPSGGAAWRYVVEVDPATGAAVMARQ